MKFNNTMAQADKKLIHPLDQRSSESAVAMCEFLFGLLDSIDTSDDMAKGNDAWYRELARHYQQRRHERIVSDGQSLFLRVHPGPENTTPPGPPIIGADGKRVPHTTDARAWAKDYCRHFPAPNEDTMTGWFANAIMAGVDETERRHNSMKEPSPKPCPTMGDPESEWTTTAQVAAQNLTSRREPATTTLEKIRGLFLTTDARDRSDAALLRRIGAMLDDGK